MADKGSRSQPEIAPAAKRSPLEPMEARQVDRLPDAPGWQFEPKWDGFRCLAWKSEDCVELYAKSGKPLGRFFPEIVTLVAELPGDGFVVDGELVIPAGDTLSFDALQLRLHPAESRIARLARETPAMLILFDMPRDESGRDLTAAPLTERRRALERFLRRAGRTERIRLSPHTQSRGEAEEWLKKAGGALDGVIAKRADGAYEAGERAMLKVKRIRSADCVVGGFRYGTGSRLVGSLLLGLYDDDGRLHHVGFTSTISAAERSSLTSTLEGLKGGPGFTGRAPGGPSRWSTERSAEWEKLRPELVVEVSFDHVSGDRFRHGTRLVRWRPDKAPHQCTFEQLGREAGPGKLVAEMIGGHAG